MAQSDNERLEGRDGEIWTQYISCWSQERIAAYHGISQSRVSRIIKKVRQSIPEEERETVRNAVIERLDMLVAAAAEIMRSHHYVVSNSGKIVYDEDGVPLRDDGPRLAAAKAIAQFDTERRKLLGLDAPAKQEISGGVKYELIGVDPEDLR